jgi:putative Mg2+ transporter-C (MgtC) family protein
MVLRPLAYRLHPVLSASVPEETLYEVRLACRTSTVVHLRALLLTTISRAPVVLQSIHSEDLGDSDETSIRAQMTTGGRNNEAIEQIVMRLSIEDAVGSLSWSAVQSVVE